MSADDHNIEVTPFGRAILSDQPSAIDQLAPGLLADLDNHMRTAIPDGHAFAHAIGQGSPQVVESLLKHFLVYIREQLLNLEFQDEVAQAIDLCNEQALIRLLLDQLPELSHIHYNAKPLQLRNSRHILVNPCTYRPYVNNQYLIQEVDGKWTVQFYPTPVSTPEEIAPETIDGLLDALPDLDPSSSWYDCNRSSLITLDVDSCIETYHGAKVAPGSSRTLVEIAALKNWSEVLEKCLPLEATSNDYLSLLFLILDPFSCPYNKHTLKCVNEIRKHYLPKGDILDQLFMQIALCIKEHMHKSKLRLTKKQRRSIGDVLNLLFVDISELSQTQRGMLFLIADRCRLRSITEACRNVFGEAVVSDCQYSHLFLTMASSWICRLGYFYPLYQCEPIQPLITIIEFIAKQPKSGSVIVLL